VFSIAAKGGSLALKEVMLWQEAQGLSSLRERRLNHRNHDNFVSTKRRLLAFCGEQYKEDN
jgi:hypothetical protein